MSKFRRSNLSPEEWAYLAGIIDGEGTICMYRLGLKYKCYTVRVHFSNTNPVLIKWVSDRLGGYIKLDNNSSRHENWKDAYTWSITHRVNIVWFLEHVLPYLVIKKQQAQIVIDSIFLLRRCVRFKSNTLSDSTLRVLGNNSDLVSKLNHGEPVEYDSTRFRSDFLTLEL